MNAVRMIVLVVAVFAVLGTAVASDFSDARTMTMGFARVGVADGASAFTDNPAGLPHLQTFGLRVSPWPSRLAGTATFNDESSYGAHYAARNAAGSMGWGAGIWHTEAGDTDSIGGGIGGDIGVWDLTGGVAVVNRQNGDDLTVMDLGLMKEFSLPLNTWRAGVVARDVTDEMGSGTIFDIGASVKLPTGLLLAADITDVTDEVASAVNLGVECPIPLTGITLRGGLADGDLTIGAGYTIANWELTAGWLNLDSGEQAVVGVTGCF